MYNSSYQDILKRVLGVCEWKSKLLPITFTEKKSTQVACGREDFKYLLLTSEVLSNELQQLKKHYDFKFEINLALYRDNRGFPCIIHSVDDMQQTSPFDTMYVVISVNCNIEDEPFQVNLSPLQVVAWTACGPDGGFLMAK